VTLNIEFLMRSSTEHHLPSSVGFFYWIGIDLQALLDDNNRSVGISRARVTTESLSHSRIGTDRAI